MSHFQVTVIQDNGAVVLFGVQASGETRALLRAYQRLSWFGQQQAEQVHLLELPGRRER